MTKKLTLQANTTLSSNKNKETFAAIDGELVNLGKTNISFSPELISAAAISLKPFDEANVEFSFLTKFVGEQFMGNTDSEVSRLDSYAVSDINLVWQIDDLLVFDNVVVTALVNNIFNKKYASNGYYFTYDDDFSNPGTITTIEGAGFYPQATTNFLLGLNLKF